MSAEIKVESGADRLFQWLAPLPLQVGSTPTLSLAHPDAVTAAPVLVPIVAEGTVTAIDRYKQELTLSAPIAGDNGVQGALGEAFFITAEDGEYSVRVKRLDGTQVILAEPLPTLPSMTTNATLQFRRWSTVLTLAAVTGTESRNWVSTVSYVSQFGADTPLAPLTDKSLLHVVLTPFATGLTSETLMEWFPDLSELVPGRQGSYRSQIKHALSLIVATIRKKMRANECSKFEDDVSGGTLQQCHAYLVASLIYQLRDAELSALLLERYEMILDESLASIWVDCNGDGIVDDGENPGQVSSSIDTSNYFATNAPDPEFTWDSNH